MWGVTDVALEQEHATADPGGRTGSVEALYPFLYAAGNTGLDSVLSDIRHSTVRKVHEIVELRQKVLDRERDRLLLCAREMAARFAEGGRLLAFGNGGSATDAQDLASLFLSPARARALPAFALTNDIAVVTALSNDVGFEVVFARQIDAIGRPGDIAVGLSTSGNSANLVRAFDEAAKSRLLTVGIAGYDGGRMSEVDSIDHLFVVPSSSVHRVQEAQTTLYHVLWELTVTALGDAAVT